MKSTKAHLYETANGLMKGLSDLVDLRQGYHYQPTAYNGVKVLTLTLNNVSSRALRPIANNLRELSMYVTTEGEAAEDIRIGRSQKKHTIKLEIVKPQFYWKQLDLRHIAHRSTGTPVATIGVDLQDKPARIDFDEPDASHILLIGQTRCGKTNTAKVFAWNIAHNLKPEQGRVVIFDIAPAKKGRDWGDFKRLPVLAADLIVDTEVAAKTLKWLDFELLRRGKISDPPRLFVLVDELKALFDIIPDSRAILTRLGSQGAGVNIHLILATQVAQVNTLGCSELLGNVGIRLCGKVTDANKAYAALGEGGTGAEQLMGLGDFLLKWNGLHRLAIAKVTDQNMALLPRGEINPLINFDDMPDSEILPTEAKPIINRGQPSQVLPVEPEHLAYLMATGMMGQKKLASGIKAAGLAETFSNERAGRVIGYLKRMNKWWSANGYSLNVE